jgi:hypothetical protein
MHALQLFDSTDTRVAAMAAFASEGVRDGDAVILIIASAHERALRAALDAAGLAVDALTATGQLTLRNAEAALSQFLWRERVNAAAFEASAGALVRQHLERFPGVRTGGEAVDLLARTGDFESAAALETLWSALAETTPLKIFCSYSSEHFGNPRHAGDLRHICGLHSHVASDRRDVLGHYLLRTRVHVLE